MRIASRVLTCSRTLASWRRLREDDRPVRAVPCALAAQTRGGVDSRDERRTLASEVLRMSRALREVLRMSCERYSTNNGASGGKGRTIPLYFSTKRRRAILDASAYTGTRFARCPYFPYSGRETPIFAQVEVKPKVVRCARRTVRQKPTQGARRARLEAPLARLLRLKKPWSRTIIRPAATTTG